MWQVRCQLTLESKVALGVETNERYEAPRERESGPMDCWFAHDGRGGGAVCLSEKAGK
ncbi:MAG: hypothetical protein JMM75_03015 [Candidatus Xiphinematobacter sp.]|nr:MAG: hypothetical protein JMM75_03015 [Candidatus Xiphinematobacter sp.]